MSSSSRRYSYANRARIQPQPVEVQAQAPAPTKRAKGVAIVSQAFAGMGGSDKALYGMIGAGIIFALLVDAAVHIFKKGGVSSSMIGDRLNINGRIYVALP